MRFFLGVVTGAALLIGAAYLHDTGTLRFGPDAAFVNWTPVGELANEIAAAAGNVTRAISNAWSTHVKA